MIWRVFLLACTAVVSSLMLGGCGHSDSWNSATSAAEG
jgi:major membrane immunogen (membrane-anchored lipoprotein)